MIPFLDRLNEKAERAGELLERYYVLFMFVCMGLIILVTFGGICVTVFGSIAAWLGH